MINKMIDIERRKLIKKSLSASTIAMVATSGLLLPQRVLAHWPTKAFNAETVEDVLLALLGKANISSSKKLNFSVGKPAKHIVNGSSISVEINSELENIERFAILVDNNPFPLVMSMDFSPDVLLPLKIMVSPSASAANFNSRRKIFHPLSVGGYFTLSKAQMMR